MTFSEFQACLQYFLIDVLLSETTHTQFWECHLLGNSENLSKVLIYIYICVCVCMYGDFTNFLTNVMSDIDRYNA